MSLKEKNSNDVYDVLGMSENFRKELIDNCFDKIDDMEYIYVTDKENIDRNIIKWDSHNYENNKNKNTGYCHAGKYPVKNSPNIGIEPGRLLLGYNIKYIITKAVCGSCNVQITKNANTSLLFFRENHSR